MGAPTVNVALLVCTYGTPEWQRRGLDTWQRHRDCGFAVSYAHHISEGTISESRNMAAEAVSSSNADWLCFLDADDCLHADYLDPMRVTMRHYNLARRVDLLTNPLLLAPSVAMGYVGGHLGEARLPNRQHSMDVMNHCVIGTLVPRELFLEVGGFPEYPIYEDWAMFLACIRAGARIVDVPESVYCASANGQRNLAGTPDWRAKVYVEIRDAHLALATP